MTGAGETVAAFAEWLTDTGMRLVEAERARALAVALATISPDYIVSAHTVTALACCRGAGYVARYAPGRVTVALCPCLRVEIVTRLTPEAR